MEDKEEEMSNNNNGTMQSILFILALILGIWIYSIVSPVFKNGTIKVNPETATTTQEEIQEPVDNSIFTTFETKDSTVIIKHYLDGIVFQSDGNYSVEVLSNDMGYILTPIDLNGNAIAPPNMFVGEGWFNMATEPIDLSIMVEFPNESVDENTNIVNIKTE